MRTETITVKLPAGYREDHLPAIESIVAKNHGDGFEVGSVDQAAGVATFVRRVQVAKVRQDAQARSMEVDLPAKLSTPSAGDRVAASFAEQYPGFTLAEFSPHLGKALFTRMSDDEIVARAAIAEVLGVKPWEVGIGPRGGGGFRLTRVPGRYTPSKHDDKLVEAAETKVPGGAPGWYVRIDPQKLTGEIVPANLPTFPASVPYPFDAPLSDTLSIPVGMTLGGAGAAGQVLAMDLDGSSGSLIQGLAGSGKSVTINSLVYGALARGHQLAIIDVPHKKVDFTWCKDLVHENWWGCESRADAVTVVSMVYEEGERRGRLIDHYNVQKWQELPASVRAENPIITVIVDELAGLFTPDPIPRSLPKEHPVRREAEQLAAETDLLKAKITKIPAEMRFAGIRLILATQQAQSNFSIPPSVKINLPNRALLGAKATKQARGHAFANSDAVPWIPEYLAADEVASRGVGVAEFEGTAFAVFKSFFAPASEYRRRLEALGVARTSHPEPTPEQVAKHTPRLDEDDLDDVRPVSALDAGGFGAPDGRDAPEPRLRGAAAASHQLAMDAARAAEQ